MSDDIIIGGDSEDIPPGTYPARLAAVSTKQSAAFGDFRAWDFLLDSGSVVGGSTSMKTGGKSKGGRWITALLGRKPSKGESVGAQILGKPCLVVVVEKDGWPAIEDVLPPMAAQAVSAPAVPAATAPPVAAGAPPISEDLPF